MGSSTSKPRKGHEKPSHLPKVGTPANMAWEHENHERRIFGSSPVVAALIGILIVAVVIGLLIITL